MSAGLWQNVGASAAGGNAPITLVHSGGAGGPQRFYRVIVD
jgi:hypothetical protein